MMQNPAFPQHLTAKRKVDSMQHPCYATTLWDISSWGNEGAVLMVRVGNCSLTEHIIQAINGGATTIVIASAVKERVA